MLLSTISSFLLLEDQIEFEKVNRIIFIGTRSSIVPLHSLSSSNSYKLIKYYDKNRKSVGQQTRGFKSVIMETSEVTTDIPMEFLKRTKCFTIKKGSYGNIKEMMDAFHLDKALVNLSKLSIVSGYALMRDYSFLKPLIVQNQLQYFECDLIPDHTHPDWDNFWLNELSNLKGLSFDSEHAVLHHMHSSFGKELNVYREVHAQICDKLESLHVFNPCILSRCGGKFENLKELCIDSKHEKLVKTEDFRILSKQNMHYLKRLNLRRSSWYITMDDPTVLWLQKALETVEYLCIGVEQSETMYIMDLLRMILNRVSGIKQTF